MITAKYERGQLSLLMQRATLARLSPGSRRQLGEGIRDLAEKVRQRAVRNVSGYPVSYTGGAFVVNVRTGALKGAIESEWPYRSEWSARVFVNGAHTSTTNIGGYPSKPVPVSRYAGAIEHGHRAIDLKKTMLGKVVPFFGARAQNATGPYAERGLVSIGGGQFISSQPRGDGKRALVYDRRRTASGGSYFITFRRVGKKGWVIPEAKPRPFMRAAASDSIEDGKRIMGRQLRLVLSER